MSKGRGVDAGSRVKEEDRIKEDRFKEQGERIKTGLRIKGKTRKMKDSGVEWIGEIPEDWEIVKIKNVYKNPKEIVGNKVNLFKRLSLTLRGVIKRPKEDAKGLQPERFEGYQILKKGQLVFKLIDLENINTSRVGLSPYVGLVSPAYIILDNEKASKYGYYFFLSMWHRQIFNQLGGDGVRSSIGPKDLLNFPYVLASYDEQEKIANFLDEKVSLIDDTIEKTKQSIEDYKKYKQALITETVTKGLNPDVEMKDSGVEWIGEVPEHWEIVKLKNIGVCFGGIIYNPVDICDEDKGTLVLRSSNVQNGKLDFSDNVYVKTNISDKYITKRGDILVCSRNGSRNLIGKNALIDKDYGYTFGAFMTIVRTKYYKFVHYFLNSNIFDAQSSLFLTSTVNQLTLGVFNNMNLVLPSEEEQQQIVDYLDNKCSEIDKIISEKEQLVKDLEIYKKSLIYECVTGKRQV